jgi:hypothetical protein
VQFKEADLVGKIMAHSMFSEMDKLSSAEQAVKNWGQLAGYGAGQAGKKLMANKGKAVAGLGAAGALAYGGKKLLSRKAPEAEKAAMVADLIESAAVDRARNFLKESGIDPDTGDQGYDLSEITEEDASELADERAMEILKEAGYLPMEKEALGYAGGMEGVKTDAADLAAMARPHLTGANALKATGSLGAVGGLAYGAKKLLAKRKASKAEATKEAAMIIEAAAMDRARNLLKEAGIDPDSGEQFGGEQDFDLSEITEEDASELADVRAEEILKEAGWLQ